MKQKIDARIAPQASLDHLKNQAKALLKKAYAGSPHALARLSRANVATEKLKSTDRSEIKLADAQLVIARENGYANWMELRKSLQQKPRLAPTTEAPLSIQGINQIWLDCTDLAATEKFYGELLGLTKTGEVPGGMLFFDCGGTTLLLYLKEEIRPNSVLYLGLENSERSIQEAYNRLKAAGVAVGDSPHCIARNWNGHDVWLAFFFDPSGNQLAFKVDVPV